MKARILALALIAATAVCADQVTYTWKGGDGNWSAPAMWTASDASQNYPNAADAIAKFPAGGSYVVTFTENIVCSNIVMNGDATHVTFKCAATQYTLNTPSVNNDHGIWAHSKDGSFTMDNMKITGGGGIFGAAISSYFKAPGENGTLRLVNKAAINYILAQFNATNAVIYFGEGCSVQIGSCYLNPPAGETYLTISNAYFQYSVPTYPAAGKGVMHFVFQGDSPQFVPRAAVAPNDSAATFEFEIPQTQYKYWPINPSEENTLANMTVNGVTFKVSKNSPARIAGVTNTTNTWKIVSWESRVLTDGKYNSGIPTNNVRWAGLRAQDGFSFGWRTGAYAQDPATANPAYMYLTLGSENGLTVILR